MTHLNIRRRWSRQPGLHGQSLVEFALVLPMLLILLLGVADFGRVFSAGITVEAAARDAAEAAAQEYVQLARNSSTALTAADYTHIHQVALAAVCDEAETLPNQVRGGSTCSMPYVGVCVHDAAAADDCDAEKSSSALPPECSVITQASNPAIEQTSPSPALPYVEVRVCYRFTTLLNLSDLQLPMGWSLSLGDVWLQRDRTFVAGLY